MISVNESRTAYKISEYIYLYIVKKIISITRIMTCLLLYFFLLHIGDKKKARENKALTTDILNK